MVRLPVNVGKSAAAKLDLNTRGILGRVVILTMLAAIWGANPACAQQVEPAKVEALMKNYDCMNCHGIDKRVVGPAFNEVAAKYKGDAGAAEKLMEKVRNGGSKVWGPVPMPANPKVSDADLKTIVAYILTLKK